MSLSVVAQDSTVPAMRSLSQPSNFAASTGVGVVAPVDKSGNQAGGAVVVTDAGLPPFVPDGTHAPQ